ncbi:unnamed protein product, partial [Meganyctiphanes norvegica]
GCEDHSVAGPSGWRPESTRQQLPNLRAVEVDYDSDDSQQSAVAKLLDDVNYTRKKSSKGIVIKDEPQTEVNKRDELGSGDVQLSALNGHQKNHRKRHRKISIKKGVTVIALSDDSSSDCDDNDSDDDKTVCSEATKIFDENVRTVKPLNIRKPKLNTEDVDFFSDNQEINVNIESRNKANDHPNSLSSNSQKSMSLLALQQNEELQENQQNFDKENTDKNMGVVKNGILNNTMRQDIIFNNSANAIHFNSDEFETSTQIFDKGAIRVPTTSSNTQNSNENVRLEEKGNSKFNPRTLVNGDVTHFRRKDDSLEWSKRKTINSNNSKSYIHHNDSDEGTDNLDGKDFSDKDRISYSPTQVFNKDVSPLTKENLDRQNSSLMSNNSVKQKRDMDLQSLPATQVFNGDRGDLRMIENAHHESPDSSTILFDVDSDEEEGNTTHEFKETSYRSQLEERMFLNDKNTGGEIERNSILSDTLPEENSSAKSLEEYSGTRSLRKENEAETENVTEPDCLDEQHTEGSIIDDDDEFKDLIDKAMEKYLSKDETRTTKTPHKTPNKSESGGKKASPCVHLHFHINNSPSPSPKKGQTSILNFFQPKNRNSVKTKLPFHENQTNTIKTTTGECSSSSDVRVSSSSSIARMSGASAAASWKPLMQKMVKLPSLTQSSGVS